VIFSIKEYLSPEIRKQETNTRIIDKLQSQEALRLDDFSTKVPHFEIMYMGSSISMW
jgi:hypothetical protein